MTEYNLRKRLFLAFFLIIIIPLPIFFIVGIKGLIPYMEKMEMYRLMRDTINIAGMLQARTKEFKSEVLFLSESQYLKELINNKGDKNRTRSALETFFVSFSRHKPIYYQIRYINEKGMEVVRVNDGRPVPVERLQDKSKRYYFIEAMKLKKGEIYASPMDLNREWGKIEMPFRPVIRYATPVFDERGNKRGIVITNVDARQFLNELQKNAIDESIRPMLIDSKGYYLSHPDRSKEWGGPRDLNTGENIKKDYPDYVVKRLQSKRADVFLDSKTKKVFAFAPIYPGTDERNAWCFVQEVSLDYGGFKTVMYLKRLIIILTTISIIAGTYLSYLLAGWLSRITCRDNRTEEK